MGIRNLVRAAKAGILQRTRAGKRRRFRVAGVSLSLVDRSGSAIFEDVVREFQADQYALGAISFRPGDVVIDIGAHVGVFSLIVAKSYPFVKVYAFEPIPDNFASLQENIRANGANNIHAFNRAVTADGRELQMVAHLPSNSGGATAQLRNLMMPGHSHYAVASTTLDRIFEELKIERCRLLKIDCEGSEHEILLSTTRLDMVDYLRGEFHINQHLRDQGYSVARLEEHCQRHLPAERIHYVMCEMAE